MAINVLDKHTAELIAAGEVVERPSSVVKELVENAIDAGATAITVEIEGGGLRLIRVADDGSGMVQADIPLAFVRHATSKVKTADDLEAITTLGFRGEALASIASVAKVRLLTQSAEEPFACEATMQGGEAGPVQEAARPKGTTIEVRDLFYNTPARMKFLKKDTSEAGFVTETVTRLALSHTEVAFTYLRDGKQVFATGGGGDLRAAAWQVLGADFARELIEVDAGDGPYSLSGLITPPRLGRASRNMQYFYINGRFVKNRTMMAGLEQAYRGLTMHGRFPGGLLFLRMPPQLVDVNVHPAKTEVRFAKEQEVFGVVYRSVKATLLEDMGGHGQLDLGGAATPAPKGPPAASPFGENVAVHQTALPKGQPLPGRPVENVAPDVEALASTSVYTPYQTRAVPQRPMAAGAAPGEAGPDISPDGADDDAALMAGVAPARPMPLPAADEGQAPQTKPGMPEPGPAAPVATGMEEPPSAPDEPPTLRLVGEAFKTYILAEAGEVLCLIDKHAAHERLLYEKIAATRGKVDSQLLLQPVTVALGAGEKDALMQNTQSLLAAGLEIEDFGDNTVLVRGVPADVHHADIAGLVAEVAGRLELNSKDTLDSKTEWVLHSIACRAAVKAGDNTPPEALLALAADIISGRVPPYCPHGRPVVLEITRKELEKQFGRLG